MNEKVEQIKLLSLTEVMDKLGVQYKKTGIDEYRIYEGGELTDGRTFHDSSDKKLIKDHTNKGRPDGDVIKFVEGYLRTDFNGVMKWFCDNFSICQEDKSVGVMDVWNKLTTLDDASRQYLESRGIQYEKVKDVVRSYMGGIGSLIWGQGRQRGICSRRITDDHKNRFVSMAGGSNSGVYMGKLDTTKNHLFVVEGMMDFLTIRQYDDNVIGLHNCEKGFDDVLKFADGYDIIFIPDNDEAGNKSRKMMESIPHKVLNLSEFEEFGEVIKDVNDFHRLVAGIGNEFGEMFMQLLFDNAQFEAPIKSVFAKLKKAKKTISERGMLGLPGPIPEIYDRYTSGIVEGKVYTIAGFSNQGKSKVAYDHASYFIKQGKKVLFINLEVSDYFCLGNIIASTEGVPFQEAMSTFEPSEKLYKKLMIKDDIYNLEAICDQIRSAQCDIVFIDFVQNIEAGGSDYEKHSKIARTMQRIAIETNVTLFCLSQLPNSALQALRTKDFDMITPKGAGEYFASSDVIIFIHQEEMINGERKLIFTIGKNKFGQAKSQHVLTMDWQRNKLSYEGLDDGTFAFVEKGGGKSKF